MIPIRPLPRSLPPLPDESLPGFLMRLSYRLEASPADLAHATGLTRSASANGSVSHIIHMPEDVRTRFARTVKTTEDEVTGMLLSPLGLRYPPASNIPSSYRQKLSSRHNRWIFLHTTRFCPDCLASGDTPIEQEFGGAWRRLWRLPPVFACPTHNRFLEHRCPDCGRPALCTVTRTTYRALPRWRDTGLHPAQCRSPLPATGPAGHGPEIGCQGRLDRCTASAPAPSEQIMAFQRHMLDLLSAAGPTTTEVLGSEAAVGNYFTDLRVLCQLIKVPATSSPTRGLPKHSTLTKQPRAKSSRSPTGPRASSMLPRWLPLPARPFWPPPTGYFDWRIPVTWASTSARW